jgi:F-type H+-transporting ATPase subunit b
MLEFNATFLIAMFSFVVFILIMNAIFYKPILNIMRKREEYINSNYEDSKRFDDTASELTISRNSKLEQTKDKCRHEVKKSIDKVQADSLEKISQVKEETKQAIQVKKEELKTQENVLKQQINDTVVNDLASSILSKLSGTKVEIRD